MGGGGGGGGGEGAVHLRYWSSCPCESCVSIAMPQSNTSQNGSHSCDRSLKVEFRLQVCDRHGSRIYSIFLQPHCLFIGMSLALYCSIAGAEGIRLWLAIESMYN